MASLVDRMQRNALVQEGEEPAERVEDLLAEYGRHADALELLVRAINRTNSETVLAQEPGLTLTDALARRDVLTMRLTTWRGIAKASTPESSRYSRTEIRQLPQVSAAELQRQADRLSAEYRTLDNAIQSANWSTTLIEAD
jgi:hypothetical protein